MRRRGRIRGSIGFCLLFGAALLWPASSQAFVGCTYSAATVNVSLTADEDSVAIERFGDQVAVVAPASSYGEPQLLLACSGGTPTVTNTDRVIVTQAPGTTDGTVQVDLGHGALGPGATPEPDGTSEIEVTASLLGRHNSLVVSGTAGADTFTLGTTNAGADGVNTNADAEPAASADADITYTGVRLVSVESRGGADSVSGAGGGGFASGSRSFLEALGGVGDDELVAGRPGALLAGQDGADLLLGSDRRDVLTGGKGRDTMVAGAGRDSVSSVKGGRDRVFCGPGRDRARFDRRDRTSGCEKIRRRRRAHPLPPVADGSGHGASSPVKPAARPHARFN